VISGGLGLWSAQFVALARLTWWEYSWDVMEPVTYFLGVSNAIIWAFVYLVVRSENSLSDLRGWLHSRRYNKLVAKEGLDLNELAKLHKIERRLMIDLGEEIPHEDAHRSHTH
jgi:hypothetical protein